MAATELPPLVVPAGASMHGVLTSNETRQIRIEGLFCGRIELQGDSHLSLLHSAEIEAELVRAHTVVIDCRFDGHVHAQVIEIGPNAKIAGSIRYDLALSVQPGARMRASIDGPLDESR